MCQTSADPSTLSEVSKEIAELINHVRLSSFCQVLADKLFNFCRYDEIRILVFANGESPTQIYPQGAATQSSLQERYLDTEYLLDPRLADGNAAPNLCRYFDLLTGQPSDQMFHQRYYSFLSFVDEVVLRFAVDSDMTMVISLGRRSAKGDVSRQEMGLLQGIYPTLEALIQQFWFSQRDNYPLRKPSSSPLEFAIDSFGNGILTRREREVATLILKGMSSKGIARTLNISVDTVKVHRKNMHARLRTSTQSDLFLAFLSHLDGLITRAA